MRLSAFLLAAASSAAFAQDPPAAQTQTSGPILTLEEAVQLAVRNNPTHLQSVSTRGRQGAALRSAYGALLPQVSSSFSTSFREGGQEIVGGQQFGSSNDILSSSYSIGVTAFYNGATIMQPRVDRANLDAAEADVTSSAASTRAQVVTQYLNVLQAQARAAAVPAPSVLPVLHRPTPEVKASVEAQYSCFVASPGKQVDVLAEIDGLMERKVKDGSAPPPPKKK